MEEILKAINNVALILNYWLPGYLFILVFRLIVGNKFNDNINIIAVVISTILKTGIVDRINISNNDFALAVTCLICICCAILVGLFYRIPGINDTFGKVFYKSFHDNIWEDVIDFERGTALVLTMYDGSILIGGFEMIEENGNDSWIALDAYRLRDSNNELVFQYDDLNQNSRIMVRVSDIKYIRTHII